MTEHTWVPMPKWKFIEQSDPEKNLRATGHMVVPCDGTDCTGLRTCPGWMWKHRDNVTNDDRERATQSESLEREVLKAISQEQP